MGKSVPVRRFTDLSAIPAGAALLLLIGAAVAGIGSLPWPRRCSRPESASSASGETGPGAPPAPAWIARRCRSICIAQPGLDNATVVAPVAAMAAAFCRPSSAASSGSNTEREPGAPQQRPPSGTAWHRSPR
ncbi:MAG: hypothetical protein R2878_01810 [Thermoleophilia bacterium]